MPAPTDIYSDNLRLALPFNLEWGFFDATSYIRRDASLQNPYQLEGNTTLSAAQNKYYTRSVYFDGSGDALIYNSPGKMEGDFTVEFWYYATNTTGTKNFLTWGDGSWKNLRNTGGNWNIETASNNGSVSVAGNIIANTWTHFAVTRSGSSIRFFSNGVQLGTTQTSTATWGTDESFRVGRRTAQTSEDFQGYLQDLRIYDGVAKYISNFTPPTQIVDVTGDTSGKNFLVLAMPFNDDYLMTDVSHRIRGHGGPKNTRHENATNISATTSKFYAKSLYIPGGNSGGADCATRNARVQARTNNDFTFATEDFTIEMWINADPGAYGGKIIDFRGTGAIPAMVGYVENTLAIFNLNGTTYSGTITRNAWQHIAFTRQNGTVRFFVNGAQTATGSNTADLGAYVDGFIGIGNNAIPGDNCYSMNGYIQDLMIYKGFAKYTSAFTPSTSGLSPNVNMSGTDMTLIDVCKVNSWNQRRVTFSGITSEFSHLILKSASKSNNGVLVDTIYYRINGDENNLYTTTVKYGEGSGYGTFNPYYPGTIGHAGYVPGTIQSRYDTFGSSEMIIFDYSTSNPKTILQDSHHVSSDPTSGATQYQSAVQGINDGGWNSSNKVTNITFYVGNESTTWAPGSIFYLYGIK